jgi:hypothetical protein
VVLGSASAAKTTERDKEGVLGTGERSSTCG